MGPKVKRTNETLWKSIVQKVKAENVGGTSPGQWSARKAQIAVKRYKDAGGRYVGPKSSKNSLVRWSRQKWRTKSGRPSHVTGERYLPEEAIKHLSASQYRRTTEAKRRSMKRHRQFSKQPADVARITKRYR